MRASRVLGLSGLVALICIFFVACGGGSKPPAPAGPPTITTTTLVQATVNQPYRATIQATGGTGTYTWSITGGTLPPGITFSNAQLSGTPTTSGSYRFTVQVTDAASKSDSKTLTLVVGGVIVFNCNSCLAGTLTLPYATPGVPLSYTLSASGGTAPYTWCVVESTGGCDNGSGGALPTGITLNTNSGATDTAVISGTPTTTQPPTQFTVQVRDSEHVSSVASAQLTLTIFGVTTTSLPDANIDAPYNQEVTAGGGQGPFNWTITSGSLPPGLSLSGTGCTNSRTPSCTISGTPTQLGTSQFTMQVTDSEQPAAVATAQLSITVSPLVTNGSLNGNYVFTLSGYNSSGPVIMAGVLVADGNGNITSGELDLNTYNGTGETIGSCPSGAGQGPQPQTFQSGSTYSIEPTGLGTMTIVTNLGTYNFHLAIRSDGSGSLIEDNGDGQWGSGAIKVQTTGIAIGALQGPFTLGLTGTSSTGNRYAAAGTYTVVNGQGDLTAGALDVDDAGANPPASQHTFLGTLSGSIDSLGRGCFVNLSFDGNPNPVYEYAYYIVSGNELVFISTDQVPGTNNPNLTLWSTLRRVGGTTAGFNNANLAKPTLVELSANNSGASDVTTGIFTGQGTTTNSCPTFDSATFAFDQNQGGTLNQQQSVQGTYCVNSVSGRVTLQGFDGIWASTPPIFYLIPSGVGFAVGTDPAVDAGNVETQSGANFSTGSINADYWGGSVAPPTSADNNWVTFLFSDGMSSMTATQCTSGPDPSQCSSPVGLTYSLDSTGRGLVKDSSGNTYGILYVVSLATNQIPSKFILLPAGTDPALNVFVGPPVQP